MAKNWAEMTPAERRAERFKRWLAPKGVKFNSQQAEKQYRERVTRFIKAVNLEEPDRVPVMLPTSFFPLYYAGSNLKEAMYDYGVMKKAWLKFMKDFSDMDLFSGPGFVLPARVLEIIDHKLHIWPGHGLPDNSTSYQYVEKEYMKADEYDKLILDPTDYWLRSYMPSFGSFFQRTPSRISFLTTTTINPKPMSRATTCTLKKRRTSMKKLNACDWQPQLP